MPIKIPVILRKTLQFRWKNGAEKISVKRGIEIFQDGVRSSYKGDTSHFPTMKLQIDFAKSKTKLVKNKKTIGGGENPIVY